MPVKRECHSNEGVRENIFLLYFWIFILVGCSILYKLQVQIYWLTFNLKKKL